MSTLLSAQLTRSLEGCEWPMWRVDEKKKITAKDGKLATVKKVCIGSLCEFFWSVLNLDVLVFYLFFRYFREHGIKMGGVFLTDPSKSWIKN